MKRNRKNLTALLLAAVLLIGCTGCGKDEDDDPTKNIAQSTGGKEITRTAAADSVFSLNSNSNYSLNPLIATNHSNQLVCSLVYENMVELDNNFNVIPNVIGQWECSEDAKQWKFTIDTETPHVFHDGSTVTGKDLRYSLERAITSDRYSGRFSSIQGVSHTDDTLQVALGIGDAQFIKLLNIPVIKSGTYNDKTPIGSGPYTYNEDCTALVAYSGYHSYATLPVDTVYIKEYQTADSIISAFEDSLIDVVINDPSSSTNLGYASTNEIHAFATTNMHYVAFNEKSVLGKFPQFRVAMQYAFDRDNFVELLNGNAVASAVPMYPTCADYPTQLADNLKYNLDTCRRVLETIGVRDFDEDGQLEFNNGSPQEIEIRFIVNSDSSAKAGVVRRFAEDMESIGLKITVKELAWDEYLKALEDGDFDMYYGEVKLRNNFDITELLQERDEDNEKSNLNFTGSSDGNFESYINAYLAAGDAGRGHAYQVLCDYLCNTTGSLITIGFEKQEIITHRGVIRGIDANIGNPLYNFANWVIELD